MLRKVYLRSLVRLGDADPDFKGILTPIEARRMGRLLKRALWTSLEALREAGLETPDAIITATDYGCIENSVEFLEAVCGEDDAPMRPVHFMQSTHNTIGSLIGIRLRCHGYNATYSHRGNSLESALLDAWTQLSLGDIDTALVGWYDETSPRLSEMLARLGIVPCDRSLALVLTADPAEALREIQPPFNASDYA